MDDVPDGFEHVKFFQGFGALMRQYHGEFVWSVKPEERFENMYHSLNTKPLMPHTECYEFPNTPPRYLGLWCLVPAGDGGGQTTLADAAPFLASLTAEELGQLASRRYTFVSANGVQEMNLGHTATHSLYENRDGRAPIFRFSYNCVEDCRDPFLLDFRERMVQFFNEEHLAIDIAPNAILLWDNHRVLHARTGFTNPRRHLRRVWLSE
jgi:alpha-ketoglutarate-dependent taurine dioxygenase